MNKNLKNFFKPLKNKILLILAVFLSLFPRSIDFLNQNPIFGFDQGREYLAAQNILINHKLTLIGTEIGAGVAGVSGIFHGPIYYYLLTIPFFIFKGNPAGGVSLLLFFGLLAVFLGYYLGQKLFGLYGGILVAILISISPVLIAQSRFIWSPNGTALFILISFYFTYLYIKEEKSYQLFLSSFFAGFIYNFELAISVPLSLALILFSIFLIKRNFRHYFYLFIGFIIAYLPMIFFELRHGFLGVRGIINYLFSHKNYLSNSYFNLLGDHLNAFISNFYTAFPMLSFYFSYLFIIIVLFGSIYFVYKEKKRSLKLFIIFLLILIPVNFLIFSFLRNAVYDYYLVDLSIGYILLFSYVVYSVFKRKNKSLILLSSLLLFIFVSFALISSIKTSIYDFSDYGATAKLKGKVDAIDFIYKDAKGQKFNLLVFAPPVYTYPYDYIISWYGKEKYGFIPGKQKQGKTYLLIEKDPSKPWSYEGWLKTVIKNGKIIKTVTLPSGFIVQEREM